MIKDDNVDALSKLNYNQILPDSYFPIHIAAQEKSIKCIEFLSNTQ